jgi:hypothetical protein
MRWYELPLEIEEYRDASWGRQESCRVDTVVQAERFVEKVGFANCLLDSRHPGPSLYVAVCGRRDAILPRNVQKDPETSHTWQLKDDLMRRGRVYYGKLLRGKAVLLAPRIIPHFFALCGVSRRAEKTRLGLVGLSAPAGATCPNATSKCSTILRKRCLNILSTHTTSGNEDSQRQAPRECGTEAVAAAVRTNPRASR